MRLQPATWWITLWSAEMMIVGARLVSFHHRRPTSRHHHFSARSRFHLFPLLTLLPPPSAAPPPVDAPHATSHRRVRPRRIQGAFRTRTTHVRLRRRARNPSTLLPPLPTLRHPLCNPPCIPLTQITFPRLPSERPARDKGNALLPGRLRRL